MAPIGRALGAAGQDCAASPTLGGRSAGPVDGMRARFRWERRHRKAKPCRACVPGHTTTTPRSSRWRSCTDTHFLSGMRTRTDALVAVPVRIDRSTAASRAERASRSETGQRSSGRPARSPTEYDRPCPRPPSRWRPPRRARLSGAGQCRRSDTGRVDAPRPWHRARARAGQPGRSRRATATRIKVERISETP
jgi:hypothetical protein